MRPRVLYLAPEPETPFRELTDALAEAFSDHPPYAGAVAQVVPHLTVAWHQDAPMDEIRADIAGALPIAARARRSVAHALRWPLANARTHTARRFGQERWLSEVSEFLELDYAAL